MKRKAKTKKEDLSGWSQDEGTPLQEEIGIYSRHKPMTGRRFVII